MDRISTLEFRVTELERKLNNLMQQLNLANPAEPVNPALAEATNWLREGNKIEAIKSYQKLAGVDLRVAKDAVDALEAKLKAS